MPGAVSEYRTPCGKHGARDLNGHDPGKLEDNMTESEVNDSTATLPDPNDPEAVAAWMREHAELSLAIQKGPSCLEIVRSDDGSLYAKGAHHGYPLDEEYPDAEAFIAACERTPIVVSWPEPA